MLDQTELQYSQNEERPKLGQAYLQSCLEENISLYI